jgi:hypothetical protein
MTFTYTGTDVSNTNIVFTVPYMANDAANLATTPANYTF